MAVISVWETWMIFNNNNVESWVKTFLGRVDEEQRSEEPAEEVVEKPVEKKGRWKSVVETSGKEAVESTGFTSIPFNAFEDEDEEMNDNVDGEPIEEEEDVDGMPMEDEDVDGEPMDDDADGEPMDDDVDGEPMDDEDVDGSPMEEPPVSAPPQQKPELQAEKPEKIEVPRPQKRQRMKAADMFTD